MVHSSPTPSASTHAGGRVRPACRKVLALSAALLFVVLDSAPVAGSDAPPPATTETPEARFKRLVGSSSSAYIERLRKSPTLGSGTTARKSHRDSTLSKAGKSYRPPASSIRGLTGVANSPLTPHSASAGFSSAQLSRRSASDPGTTLISPLSNELSVLRLESLATLTPEAPRAAVVVASSAAAKLGSMILPRFMALALETHVRENRLRVYMPPLLPGMNSYVEPRLGTGETADSIVPGTDERVRQYAVYSRDRRESPIPGVFEVRQKRTPVVAMRTDLSADLGLWFEYKLDMLGLAFQLPVTSRTAQIAFNGPNEIRMTVDLRNSFKLSYGSYFRMSPALEGTLVVGGAAVTALTFLLSPVAATFVGALVGLVELVQDRWITLDAAYSNFKIDPFVLYLDGSKDNDLIVRDAQLQLSIGDLVLIGDTFQKVLDLLTSYLGRGTATILGLEETDAASCTTLTACMSALVEVLFDRGYLGTSLSPSESENCWQRSADGRRTLKRNPLSQKCQLVAAVNTGLRNALAVGYQPNSLNQVLLKEALRIRDGHLQAIAHYDIDAAERDPACFPALADYRPQTFSTFEGGANYSLRPAGDLDLFLPVNLVEKVVHVAVSSGDACRNARIEAPFGRNDPADFLAFGPAGQFEIATAFEYYRLSERGFTRVSSTTPNLASLLSDGSVGQYVKLSAPLIAEGGTSMTLQLSGAPAATSVAVAVRARGTLEFIAKLESSCGAGSPELLVSPSSGRIRDLAFEIVDPGGTVRACTTALCPWTGTLQSLFDSTWNALLADLGGIPLPAMVRYAEAGLFFSVDPSRVQIRDGKAFQFPFSVTDANPCAPTAGTPTSIDGGPYPAPGSGVRPPVIDVFNRFRDPSDEEGIEGQPSGTRTSPALVQ